MAGGPVVALVFARRGRFLVTAARKGVIRIWKTRTWRPVRSIRGPPFLRRVEVDPAGTRVAAVAVNRFVPVYAVSTGKLLRRLNGHGFVGDAAFSPDGRSLATSDYVGNVRVWRTSDLSLVRMLRGGQRNIPDLAWSPDGTKLAGASADATSRLWNVRNGLQMAVMVHDEAVSSVAFSPDGENLATVTGDTARVWGAAPDRAGRPISVLSGHTGPIIAAVFSPNGRTVATGASDRTVRIWDPGSELELRVRARQHTPFTALAAAPGGARVVTGDAGGLVQAWTPRGRRLGRPARAGSVVNDVAVAGHASAAAVEPDVAIAISPYGSERAVARGRTVRVFGHGRIITKRFAHDPQAIQKFDPIHDLAFSRDGGTLAVAMDDGTVRLWRIGAPSSVRVLRSQHPFLVSVAFSHDGRLVVASSLDSDAVIWDVANGAVVRVLRGHFGSVRSAVFSADDRWVLTAGPTTAGLWNMATGELRFLRGPTDELLTSAVWAGPDGWTVLTTSKAGTLRTFRCDLCGEPGDLLALARRRLAARR